MPGARAGRGEGRGLRTGACGCRVGLSGRARSTEVEVRRGRPGAPAPRAARPLVRPRGWSEGGASGERTWGRGWGESGEVSGRVGPALAGHQVTTRVPPTVTFWLACKGPDFPKGLMHLPLKFDSSPRLSGRAPVRKNSSLAGQLEAGSSNLWSCAQLFSPGVGVPWPLANY